MTQAVNVPGVGTLNFPDGMSQADMAAAIQKNFPQIHPQAQTPESQAMTSAKNAAGGAEGVFDAFGNMASAIPAGVAGAAGFVKGLVTPGQDAGNTAQDWMDATQQFMNKPRLTIGTPEAQQGQAYQKGNKAAQQGINATVGAIPNAVKGLYNAGQQAEADVARKTMTPAQFQQYQANQGNRQAIGGAIADVTENLIAPGIAAKMTKGVVNAVKPEVTPFAEARALNIKIPPSYAKVAGGRTFAGPTIEGMGGGAPKTAVEASVSNAPAINDAIGKDIGVNINEHSSYDSLNNALDEAAQPHYAAYTAMKSLGKNIPIDGQFKSTVANLGQESADAFPLDSSPALEKLKQAYLAPDSFGANGAVLKIRQLRKDGDLNIRTQDPEKVTLGYAQKQIATAIEDQMDRYAQSRVEGFEAPNVVKNFRDARKSIAQIESVRDAIKPGTTDVSAKLVSKMVNKSPDKFSGNFRKIGMLYNEFYPAMQDVGPLRNKVPVNRLDAMVGTAGAGIGLLKHEPSAMLAAAGYIFGPPLIRKGLLSNAYQNSMLPRNPLSPEMLQLLSGGTLGALQNPLSGGQ